MTPDTPNLSSASSIPSWGPLQPLVDEVMQGHLDGFEIPYEATHLVPAFWPDGMQVRQYRGRGTLIFRQGAHENYGYTTPEEFQKDVEKGSVLARTIEGAISIGRARLIEGGVFHISMKVPDLPVSMRFVGQNLLEAKTIQEQLQKIMPHATIQIAQSEMTLVLGKALSARSNINWSKIKTLPSHKKKALAFIFIGALICMIFSLLALFHILSLWFEIIATACFAILFILALAYLQDIIPGHEKSPQLDADHPGSFSVNESDKKIQNNLKQADTKIVKNKKFKSSGKKGKKK